MMIVKKPEEGKMFLGYEIDGNTINFRDGELSIRLDKKERDYDVTIDICEDYTGGLVVGAGAGDRYAAQLTIPAREYTEEVKNNPEYNPDNTEGTGQPTITELIPVPFSMDKCTLMLYNFSESQ